jgi:hypothetical protein
MEFRSAPSRCAVVHHLKARVAHSVLAAHRLKVLLPALAVRRVSLKALDPERPIREADMADNELLPRPSSASAQWQQPRGQSKLQ